MKNLLHLGEDRYLTTLLFNHFLHFKTQFIWDALAYIVAPDDWKVLLSLTPAMEQLGGFHCFSMRLIVMIDLLLILMQACYSGSLCH
jgi:chitin synthase